MIAILRGTLLRKTGRQIVVDVNGLGFEVLVPDSTAAGLPQTGETVQIETLTVVQEDGIHLYGFATRAEKETFRLVTSVSKVGAKIALEMLSSMSVEQFREAIVGGQMSRLLAVPGIGKKLAERIRFELKDKVGTLPAAEPSAKPIRQSTGGDKLEDTVRGLIYLGVRDLDARRCVETALNSLGDEASVQDLIREALRLTKEQ